jgi:hypothetical protein
VWDSKPKTRRMPIIDDFEAENEHKEDRQTDTQFEYCMLKSRWLLRAMYWLNDGT